MEKRIGIITLYHGNYNFGGLLQAYALPKAIRKYFDLNAEQIDYIHVSKNNDTDIKKTNVSLPNQIHRIIYKSGIWLFTKINEKKLRYRDSAFDNFIKEIPHSQMVYDYNTISKCSECYDIFICGGDQIWNDYGCDDNTEVYTLQFVSGEKIKIAYAPSMAILEFGNSFKDVMREGLKQLDNISIREKQSMSILQPLTNKKIEVVVDPVLLLERHDWELELKTVKHTKKYILCYLLGDNEEQRKAVNQLARKLKLPIVTFPHIMLNVVRKCDLFFGDIHDYTSGPREFLGLIRNAEFVITDSFHACVFSMIFETSFVVFERNKASEKGNMNSRIYDFLEEYHLEKQLVSETQLKEMKAVPNIDFVYSHEHWNERRIESLRYLEKALKRNLNGEKK